MNLNRQNQLLVCGKEVVFCAVNDARLTVTEITDSISLYGYSPDDFISGKIGWRDIVHPDDKNFFTECPDEQECRIFAKSGEIMQVLCVCVADDATGVLYFKVKDISRYIQRNEQKLDRKSVV